MFADTKRVQPDLVGMLDLLDQLLQTLCWIHGPDVLVERGGETVNPYLHNWKTGFSHASI